MRDKKDQIEEILEPLISSRLECDGFVRIASTWLLDSGIQHDVFIGRVCRIDDASAIYPHFWIGFDDFIADYRAKLWLGDDPFIPYGIFDPKEFPMVSYGGEKVKLEKLDEEVISILLDGKQKH